MTTSNASQTWRLSAAAFALFFTITTSFLWAGGYATNRAYLRSFSITRDLGPTTFQEFVYIGGLHLALPVATALLMVIGATFGLAFFMDLLEGLRRKMEACRWPRLRKLAYAARPAQQRPIKTLAIRSRLLLVGMSAYFALLLAAGVFYVLERAEHTGAALGQRDLEKLCLEADTKKSKALPYVVFDAKPRPDVSADEIVDEGFLIACNASSCAVYRADDADAPVHEVLLAEVRGIRYLAKPPAEACQGAVIRPTGFVAERSSESDAT